MFSVIIPLYNKSNTVERAIRSVLAQTEKAFELIIVDDGSTDDGIEKVKNFNDERIRLLQQPNGGVAAARNTGIAAAHNDYITFLDADDEYLPEFLATVRDLIRDFPQAGIWGTGYYYAYPDGINEIPLICGIENGFRGILADYFSTTAKSAPVFWTGAVCIKKTVLDEIKGFPVGVTSGEDLLTWARICAAYPAAYSYTQCAKFYLGDIAGYLPTRVPQVGNYVGTELIKLLKQSRNQSLRKYIALWQKNRFSCFTRLGMRKHALYDCLVAIHYWPFEKKIYFYIILNLLPEQAVRFLLTHWQKGGAKR